MFWIGLIVVRIDFQKHHVFRSCDISTSWKMGQTKVRDRVRGFSRWERMRVFGIKKVMDRASIRVRVMEWCKSRFIVNFSLMTRAQRNAWYRLVLSNINISIWKIVNKIKFNLRTSTYSKYHTWIWRWSLLITLIKYWINFPSAWRNYNNFHMKLDK